MRALVVGILGAVALAGAWGCDTFRPRRPEAPAGPPLHVAYNSPDSTLDTMRRGIENRTDAGILAYVGALADSGTEGRAFLAFMDPAAALRWEQGSQKPPPDAWDRSREQSFVSRFLSTVITRECQMVWEKDTRYPDVIGSGEVVYYRHYLVLLTGEATPSDTVAIGYAALTLDQLGANWKLTRWQDQVDPEIGVDPRNSQWLSFTVRRLDTY